MNMVRFLTFVSLCVVVLAQSLGCSQNPAYPSMTMADGSTAPRLNAATFFAHGHLLERQGNFQAAVERYRSAIRARPDFMTARNRLAIALNKLGKHAEASAEFRRAMAIRPGQAHLHNNLGFSLFLEEKFAEAEAACSKALAIRPSFTRAHMNRALALAKLERFDEAFAEFSLSGTLANAHFNLAVVLADAGRYADSMNEFEVAMRLDPSFEAARRQLYEVTALAAQNAPAAAEPSNLLPAMDAVDVEALAGDAGLPAGEYASVIAENTPEASEAVVVDWDSLDLPEIPADEQQTTSPSMEPAAPSLEELPAPPAAAESVAHDVETPETNVEAEEPFVTQWWTDVVTSALSASEKMSASRGPAENRQHDTDADTKVEPKTLDVVAVERLDIAASGSETPEAGRTAPAGTTLVPTPTPEAVEAPPLDKTPLYETSPMPLEADELFSIAPEPKAAPESDTALVVSEPVNDAILTAAVASPIPPAPPELEPAHRVAIALPSSAHLSFVIGDCSADALTLAHLYDAIVEAATTGSGSLEALWYQFDAYVAATPGPAAWRTSGLE